MPTEFQSINCFLIGSITIFSFRDDIVIVSRSKNEDHAHLVKDGLKKVEDENYELIEPNDILQQPK